MHQFHQKELNMIDRNIVLFILLSIVFSFYIGILWGIKDSKIYHTPIWTQWKLRYYTWAIKRLSHKCNILNSLVRKSGGNAYLTKRNLIAAKIDHLDYLKGRCIGLDNMERNRK